VAYSDNLNDAIVELSDAFVDFKKHQDSRLDEVATRLNEIEKRAERARLTGGGGGAANGAEPEAPKEMKAAYGAFIRKGDDRELRSMSVASDPDGGYSVLGYVSPTIDRIVRELSPMRGLARVVPLVGSDSFSELQDRGSAPAAVWIGETEGRPATEGPKLSKVEIFAKEIYAQPEVTQQLLDDSSFDIEGYLAGKLAESFAAAEGDAFFNGMDNSRPRGFLTYPTVATGDATRPWGKWQHVATGAAGAFKTGTGLNGAEVFIDTIAALKPTYRTRAVWMMNRSAFATVAKMQDTTGRFLLQVNVAAGVPPSLLGYPVVTAEGMPDIGSGSLSIAFGDFSRGYTIVDRVGVRILRDPFSAKPFVRFYATKRVGGDASNFEAIKLVKFAAS
jgi:HK97 family phage major capsid protein